jgi:hypothetical protein
MLRQISSLGKSLDLQSVERVNDRLLMVGPSTLRTKNIAIDRVKIEGLESKYME